MAKGKPVEIIPARDKQPDPLLAVWGERIASTRLLRNRDGDIRRPGQDPMSQADLAALLGIRQATVSRWEGGWMEPTRARKFEIADALGVPASSLFSLPMEGAA